MNFKSRTEAYSYAILSLTELYKKKTKEDYVLVILINQCICNIKIAMENHEQNPKMVALLIKELMEQGDFLKEEQDLLSSLIISIQNSTYQQTVNEKFENPLARRLESEIAIALLQNPTKAMMASVKGVSEKILDLIEQLFLLKNLFDWSVYVKIFNESYHAISFGAEKNPTLDGIKKILMENKPEQFVEIMHIHYKFAQGITRKFPIHGVEREPVGKLAEIVKQIWDGSPAKFFSEGLSQECMGAYYRCYVADTLMYESPLYKVLDNRGKIPNNFNLKSTQQLGLMCWGQTEYEVDLPQHSSTWTADCKAQGANLQSQYVLDLVENDAVYVAGPSGMASVLLGQMEILANFPNVNLKKHYLTAMMSYIVAAGFHSIHEVIAPAHYALDLVPGYEVHVPQLGKLAPPPNYNLFFTQQEYIDQDFGNCRDMAWANYLRYFKSYYVPQHIRKLPTDLSPCSITSESTEVVVSELINQVRAEMNRYINARGSSDGALSFISWMFRNNDLTKEKLAIALTFNSQLDCVSTLSELNTLVDNTIRANRAAEDKIGKTYGVLTKSGLNRSLEHIKAMINMSIYHQETLKF